MFAAGNATSNNFMKGFFQKVLLNKRKFAPNSTWSGKFVFNQWVTTYLTYVKDRGF